MTYMETVVEAQTRYIACLGRIREYLVANRLDLGSSQALVLWRFTGDSPRTACEVGGLGYSSNGSWNVTRLRELGYLELVPLKRGEDHRITLLKLTEKGKSLRDSLGLYLEHYHVPH